MNSNTDEEMVYLLKNVKPWEWPAGELMDVKITNMTGSWPGIKPFSTDITLAYRLLEDLRTKGVHIEIDVDRVWCHVGMNPADITGGLDTPSPVSAEADTLPLAICRAYVRLKP